MLRPDANGVNSVRREGLLMKMESCMNRAKRHIRDRNRAGIFLIAAALLTSAGCGNRGASPGLELQSEDYSKARGHFQTHLVQRGPAPQQWTPLRTPSGAQAVTYSRSPSLAGWISPAPTGGRKRPAVLFLHGGFAVDESDWEMTAPYRDAGYVVMMPILRGENGQDGDYSMFYNEVDDVLAAADYLASVPYVDKSHVYVAGHSVGGTLTLLAAMASTRFRAAASFSGSPDQIAWSKNQPELIPFDRSDTREYRMRSPVAFATSFKCPVRIYCGSREALFGGISRVTASLAKGKGLDVEAVTVPGDHMSAVPEETEQSIRFFQSK